MHPARSSWLNDSPAPDYIDLTDDAPGPLSLERYGYNTGATSLGVTRWGRGHHRALSASSSVVVANKPGPSIERPSQNDAFDFGRGDPLPPPASRYRTPSRFETTRYDEEISRPRQIFQSLARSTDRDLSQYLNSRHISRGFLNEIDMFLDGHLELDKYCPDFVKKYNSKEPLEAYRFFVKGYTRPARYMDGFLPGNDDDLRLTLQAPVASNTAAKTDDELMDFFDGYEYRFDILAKIDDEVRRLTMALHYGRNLKRHERVLVVLALYGNPSDAYKHYEYQYQTDWLPHTYLPEHVILSELPRSTLPGPKAHRLGQFDEVTEEMRSYPFTRSRMARAHDAGVDVCDVLLQDLEKECAAKGLRRSEIQRISNRATRDLDDERERPKGKDIVDLVMSRVPDTQTRHYERQPRKYGTQRRQGRGNRVGSLRSTLETLVRQESVMLGMFERARRYSNAGWNEYLDHEAVRDSRVRVERQLLTEMVAQKRANGQWSNNRCRDIMWEHSKGTLDVLGLYR